MAQVSYSLKIDTETDADLVRWLDAQPNKSEAIREALRVHIRRSGVTLGDILQAVHDLDQRIRAGAVQVHGIQ